MVQSSSLLSTLLVGACCLPAASFTPNDSSSLQHARLDRLLEVVSSDAPRVQIVPSTSVNDDYDDDESFRTKPQNEDSNDVGTAENNLRDLPPVLQQITDERRNFQMNLGKAMDTLRKDMPYILKQTPDFSIYHPDITVADPSGITLRGLDSYKSSVAFLQQFTKFWFHERSGLQYRMVYDFARSSIRVSWHVVLAPKVPLGKPLHIDGISMYKLDVDSGKIIEHKFESMMINNTPVMPPYGVFSLLQQEWGMGAAQTGVATPAGI